MMGGEINGIENKGFYKLTWIQRIAYGLAGAALIIVYNTFAYFYNMNGNNKNINTYLMLFIDIIAFFWSFLVAFIIDKYTTHWGKYRFYLFTSGFPLILITILFVSFSKVMESFIILFTILYIIYRLLYPCINLSFNALNASLTRDIHEITVLIITASVLSNIGDIVFNMRSTNFLLSTLTYNLPPTVILCFIPTLRKLIGKKKIFYVFGIISIFGYAMRYLYNKMLYIDLLDTIGKITVDTCVGVITGYMWVFVPEIISFSENNINRRNAGIIYALVLLFSKIGNAIGGFLMTMILTYTGYQAKNIEIGYDDESLIGFNFVTILTLLICLMLLIFCFIQINERVVTTKQEAKNVKISDIWCEIFRNKPLRFFGYFLIVFYVIINLNNNSSLYLDLTSGQTEMAIEGIRWASSIVPIILILLMMIIIHFYNLTDERVDRINRDIEIRNYEKSIEEF